jgi:2-dehydro-3-deoxy-D-arabinonate dehydratase
MRIIRYKNEDNAVLLGAVTDTDVVYTLPFADFLEVVMEAEQQGMTTLAFVEREIASREPLTTDFYGLDLLVPIEAPEVWAAGVTYEKSRDARNYEATLGKEIQETYYDKVYDAVRPEIFFKSTAARTIGPNQPVFLRSDSEWQIPEPEVGLVITKEGKIAGYTIGNDMSCRDIEGENPLYLPQAKIWKNSCAIGPAIRIAEAVENPYDFQLTCRIYRDEKLLVEGTANTSQLKRKFDELVSFLIRDNEVFDGTVLLTGTSVVPPNDFTLQDNDYIEIEISQLGVLKNPVRSQQPSRAALK